MGDITEQDTTTRYDSGIQRALLGHLGQVAVGMSFIVDHPLRREEGKGTFREREIIRV